MSDGTVDTSSIALASHQDYTLGVTGGCGIVGSYEAGLGFPFSSASACQGSVQVDDDGYDDGAPEPDMYDSVNTIVQNCGVPVITVTSPDSGKLPVGQSRVYTASALYASTGACTGSLTERTHDITGMADWEDSDDLGSFNRGVFTAEDNGTTDITATYNGATSPATTVELVDVTLESLTISAASSVADSTAIDLNLTATWTDGTTDFALAPPDGTTCSANNANVTVGGNVTDGFTITGVTAGATSVITCVDTDSTPDVYSNSVLVSVTSACIASISDINVDQVTTNLYAGVPFTLAVECEDSNGDVVDNCVATYAVTTDANAAIDTAFFGAAALTDAGRARVSMDADNGNTAVITATVSEANGACTGGVAGTIGITVLAGGLETIEVDGDETLATNVTSDYTATGYWNGDDFDLTYAAEFISLNTDVGSIVGETNTMQTHLLEGTTTVRAAYEGVVSLGVDQELDVTVEGKQVDHIVISAADETLVGGGTETAQIPANGFHAQLLATVYYTDGSFEDVTDEAEWSLVAPPPSVLFGATVGTDTGVFTSGSGTGAQTVEAAYNLGSDDQLLDSTDTFVVTIVDGAVETLTIVNADNTPASTSIVKGLTNSYGAQATLVGSTAKYWVTDDVTFYTSAASVANYVAHGVLFGSTVGTTNITVGGGGVVSTPITVTVSEKEPIGIACTPDPLCTTVGDKSQVHVVVSFTDGTSQVVTADMARADYSSDAPLVAGFLSQDPIGVITGISVSGTEPSDAAVVSVAWGDFTAQCDVFVAVDITDLAGICQLPD
jgi:hypothetical protein